ncbi:uncharacterized protein BX663DRAFT_518954 [Cokeromyces recurvatus]|uniref:uncharacterized protein n=1 Tax=Cokeromyces recurvatus TaxID=90255 RepID=UPI00221F0AFB|nr:uncharacterized protein BX663DRAFT_518954 [Cokeromyces recurvatus]KAI7900212.1 hypothetical protein BX663DRAFT_518954 [Cokeromyces recurvatus]
MNSIVNTFEANSSFGHITLNDYTVEFIDTPQFQRLRGLKQLGVLYFVFPGASHNRFEHSIGVSHLSGTLIERFARDQPELDIRNDEIRWHGPFSHVFDNVFMPQAKPGLNWSHEQGSEMMLDYLVDDNHIDIEKQDIQFMKDLIMGEPTSSFSQKYADRRFLFDIVANKKNSVDVDKFDYIERDAYNMGLRSSYDAKRLLVYSRVIHDEICYHHKELFKQIYNHRVGKAIELMIVDALLSADSYLKISDAVNKPEEYLYLNDIIHTIEKIQITRNLYKFVDEYLIPPELELFLNKDRVTPQDIVNHQTDNAGLVQEDIIVDFSKVNYSMNDSNPVDSIRFFSKFNQEESFKIPQEKVSYMIPNKFQDINIRIYTRNPYKMQAVQKAFRRYLANITHTETLMDPSITVPADYENFVIAKKRRISSIEDKGK